METFLLQTKTERSGNVGTLSIEDSAFESLEKDFQEVLQELMGDRYAQAEVPSMYVADPQNIWLIIPVDMHVKQLITIHQIVHVLGNKICFDYLRKI